MNNIKEFVNEDKVEKILRSLISINSTQPDGNETEVVKYILSIFKDYEINYEEINHKENRSSLIINIEGEDKNNSIAFLGHLDTVPVEDYDKWELPPFDGKVKDGYMYGRGSADMKGGITSMVLTLLYILENNIVPRQNIKFCFTADEEYRGMGILSMKDHQVLKDTRFMIVAEPTDEKLGIAEKGALWLEIEVEGISAHGSRPDLGVNSIEYLYKFIEQFRLQIESDDLHELLGKTTISTNTFQGGVGLNVVPTKASANLDIRTIPGEDHEDILHTAETLSSQFMKDKDKLKFDIKIKNNRAALEVSKTDSFIENIREVFKEMDYDTDYKGLFFYTDASQIVPQLKVPFIILGPGDDKMAHQRNERVKLSSVSKIAEVYIRYVLKV